MQDRTVFAGIAFVSAAVFVFLLVLIYGRTGTAADAARYASLPAWNAFFNTCSASCLVAGWRAIRAGNRRLHAGLMLSALGFSALFLVSYVVYHSVHGDTRFAGEGWVRTSYLAILASHVLVTAAALPMILATLYYAAGGRFDSHRRLARRTLPAWLYVSVTGVAIFAMLRAYG